MARFMLLLRGSQEYFSTLSQAEQAEVIKLYDDWAKKLNSLNKLAGGSGFSNATVKLFKENGKIQQLEKPYANTSEELSGYFMLEVDSFAEAVELAHECPGLLFNETVEVVPFDH